MLGPQNPISSKDDMGNWEIQQFDVNKKTSWWFRTMETSKLKCDVLINLYMKKYEKRKQRSYWDLQETKKTIGTPLAALNLYQNCLIQEFFYPNTSMSKMTRPV